MKKFIGAVGLVCGLSLFAKSGLSDVDELLRLPHPVKAVMSNMQKLKVTKEQEELINTKMLAVFPSAIQSRMKKASKLEKEIKSEILTSNKNKDQLRNKIDQLAKIKREVTDIHIDALNTLASIMTKEQMQKALKFMQNKQKPQGAKKSNKFKIDELAILPHPGKLIKTGKVQVSMDQKMRFKKEVKSKFPPIFQAKMREAFTLEKKLQRAVAKGKTKEDLKQLLDDIARLKREAMDGRIDALNELQKILEKDQWKMINKLTYK